MKVLLKLPQDAVPQENDHRRVEMDALPRVGDFIGHDRVKNMLVVVSVSWSITSAVPFDACDVPVVECDWAYETWPS